MMSKLPKAESARQMTDKEKVATYPIYEVYGASSRAQGWDFFVCKTAADALEVVARDIDELDPDPDAEDEVKIVFRRYTQAQMDEVIYE